MKYRLKMKLCFLFPLLSLCFASTPTPQTDTCGFLKREKLLGGTENGTRHWAGKLFLNDTKYFCQFSNHTGSPNCGIKTRKRVLLAR